MAVLEFAYRPDPDKDDKALVKAWEDGHNKYGVLMTELSAYLSCLDLDTYDGNIEELQNMSRGDKVLLAALLMLAGR